MRKRILVYTLTLAFVLGAALPAAVLAGDNGQKVGQDPVKLALTQCSNAGAGNGSEIDGVYFFGLRLDCLHRVLGDDPNFKDLKEAIIGAFEFGDCDWFERFDGKKYIVACEYDPGNSGANNQAGD